MLQQKPCLIIACAIAALAIAVDRLAAAGPQRPCRLEVIDKETRWPVPMVELRTTNFVKFVTDNAGRIAFDLPELMGAETWFAVTSDGYEVRADGFGHRGVRLTPKPGETLTIEVNRTSIAKRLGRVTGAGLFGESQKLGLESLWKETGVLGCDSVQNAVHNGRLFWAWGDTSVARYPLGIFDSTGAISPIRPLKKFEPPLRIQLDHFSDSSGRPRGIAKMPGSGPTWLVACASLPDNLRKERLVSTYIKVNPPLDPYETGLCAWNDATENFELVRTLWTKSASSPKHPPMPEGHAVIFEDDGQKWVLFGNPLPALKCLATYEAWQNPASWEVLKPQESLNSAADGKPVKPSSGSIAWNEFRKRWVTVFMQEFGTPSAFGEIWYAEADSPLGPWGPAVKVLSHKNYSFYNPSLHPAFTPPTSPILLFEGTHSQTFANHPEPTPRYDYNQIMYRLDLDDPQLAPAQKSSR